MNFDIIKESLFARKKIMLLNNLSFAVKSGAHFSKVTESVIDPEITKYIDKGLTFSDSLFRTGKITQEEKRYLSNFEKTGNLYSGIISLKNMLEKRERFGQNCLKEMTYPILMGVMLVLILSAVKFFTVGFISAFFQFIIYSFFFGIFLLFFLRLIFSLSSEKILLINNLYTLYGLIRSGTGFETIKDTFGIYSCGNIAELGRKLRFPNDVVSVLTTAEISGDLENAIEKYISYYEEITEANLKRLATVIGFSFYFLMAGVYIFKIFTTYTSAMNI